MATPRQPPVQSQTAVNPQNEESREYRNLNRRRRGLKLELSEFLKFSQVSTDKSFSNQLINIRLEQVNNIIQEFKDVQSRLEELDTREEDFHTAERIQFNEAVFEVKAALMSLTNDQGKLSMDNSQTNLTNMSDSIRLPTVPAPTFDGNLQNWSAFRDSFDAMFHCNNALANVQKLHYLKSCLIGSAREVIKNITTTGDNYQRAYDTLIARYEHKSLIIQSHIRSLLDTPKVKIASTIELRNLHHHVMSHVKALEALDQPVTQWDAWLVTLVCCRMDSVTVGEWQLRQQSRELPKFTNLEAFLANRVSAYEVGEFERPEEESNVNIKYDNRAPRQHTKKVLFANQRRNENYQKKCSLCSGEHRLYTCNQFINMSVEEKRKLVKNKALCFNCMSPSHLSNSCFGSGCKTCGKKHNTMLHINFTPSDHQNQEVSTLSEPVAMYAHNIVKQPITDEHFYAMIATAIIYLSDIHGNLQPCRTIIDSGSQLNFMSHQCVKKLHLKVTNNCTPISGIGSNRLTSKRLLPLNMFSRFNKNIAEVVFHALPVISSNLPSHNVIMDNVIIPEHIHSELADPQFHKTGPIECLLGADLVYDLFNDVRFPITENLTAHSTQLGWVITGRLFDPTTYPAHSFTASQTNSACSLSAISLHATVLSSRIKEEDAAKEHFHSTVQRDASGRFIVRFPFNQDPKNLGHSRSIAEKRFLTLENRIRNNINLSIEYHKFMNEYINLGHMEPVINEDIAPNPVYYLPHQIVTKADSLTTKVRVVFDGSAVTSSGLSLNDILLRGPTVQPNLFSILLRFRVHSVVITADVAKMYRQVKMHPGDCNLQRICYRANPGLPVEDFRLLTVTYGTKSAAYLATQALSQVADDSNDLVIQRVIKNDFYVDDLITGGPNDEHCLELYTTISKLLKGAGFELRKWCTNSQSLLSCLPVEADPNHVLTLIESDTVSALGLSWQPSSDCFKFNVKSWVQPVKISKRSLLSDINQIFDPIGLLTPALIKGKVFIQQLWALKIDWDSPLPKELQKKWENYYKSLKYLEQLSIPRKVCCNHYEAISIHGFSDASQLAYGACVYVQSKNASGAVFSSLYTSKSRVAPLGQTTIPRLELCGALLLANVMKEALSELKGLGISFKNCDVTYWTDSTVVLSWINYSQPLKAYVSNRVAQILDLTMSNQWHHISTKINPADLITRGISAKDLIDSSIWLNGPSFLLQDRKLWPSFTFTPLNTVPEQRPMKLVLMNVDQTNYILERFSNWSQLIRTTGWINRFMNNLKSKLSSTAPLTGPLSVKELDDSANIWLRYAQLEFSEELSTLRKDQSVDAKSRLKSLNPLVDNVGLIRVGGRLNMSTLPKPRKFPIVLPSRHRVTNMIFIQEHLRLLHAGPQALMASIQTRYWPLRGRIVARNIVHKCTTCFKFRPKFSFPLMAPLPRERVVIDRPFNRCGVDFCGPILIKSGIRRVRAIKCYISVFICFVTRAVHLELVSDLTSEAFIAALTRFMSRRGVCSHIHSDNGTNFVGANKVLQQYFETTNKSKSVVDEMASKGVQWHFIPPSAPHFGGLWEAAVKSAKHHLLKATKGALLNFEEISTLLCRIELILNSRPLTSISSEPSDYEALTPNHFLVGGPATLPQEPDVSEIPQNRLRRFQLMRSQYQLFWKRWSKEYLPQLQRRGRWTTQTRKVEIGDLAILKDDNLPPLQWKMVRIAAIHPGADGIVRVVTVRLSSGTELKRPVAKIALLPRASEEETNVTTSEP